MLNTEEIQGCEVGAHLPIYSATYCGLGITIARIQLTLPCK